MSDCDCYDNPPWWPSQLQGEPWRHIEMFALPAASAREADDNAKKLATMRANALDVTVEAMPCEGELWAQALAEVRRRYAVDPDGSTVDDDGRITLSDHSLWFRMLRFAVKHRTITGFGTDWKTP